MQQVRLDRFESLTVNEKGRLCVGGADAVELVARFGSPLYVIDEGALRAACAGWRDAFAKHYPDSLVIFASKALGLQSVFRIADEEKLGLDVSSVGELYGAAMAGVPLDKVYLHGSFKKEEELRQALTMGVGRIVLDSPEEADALDAVARSMGLRAPALLRVTPGIEAHTHHLIQTGRLDTKFGVTLEGGEAFHMVKKVIGKKNIDLVGLHCHIGSQILETKPFRLAVAKMLSFLVELRDGLKFEARELDMGGGYAIRYKSAQGLPPRERVAAALCDELKKGVKSLGLRPPRLIVEPGRSIAGPAGVTLYTVGPVKEIPSVRRYVSVDGGLSDNPRPVMYDSEYDVLIADRAARKPTAVYRVCGRHCETDTLFDAPLHNPKYGDIMAVLATGAYNHSMSSNYNKFPRPAVALIRDGKAEIIAERETLDSLFANDRIPRRLHAKPKKVSRR